MVFDKTFQNSRQKAIRLYLVEWFIYGTLKFVILGTLEFVQRMIPKDNVGCLDNAYLATMKCVAVNKAFKQVAEKQTKIKVNRQLKALGSFSTRRNFPLGMIFSFVF